MRFVFTWIVCHVLQMVNKKADLLLKVDLFLFQNLSIISHCVVLSMTKILEKYFIFLLTTKENLL